MFQDKKKFSETTEQNSLIFHTDDPCVGLVLNFQEFGSEMNKLFKSAD